MQHYGLARQCVGEPIAPALPLAHRHAECKSLAHCLVQPQWFADGLLDALTSRYTKQLDINGRFTVADGVGKRYGRSNTTRHPDVVSIAIPDSVADGDAKLGRRFAQRDAQRGGRVGDGDSVSLAHGVSFDDAEP